MAASIVMIKAFTYRGSSEEYSTRYHFDGGAPATQPMWLVLDNAVRAAEKLILGPTQSIVRTLGYAEDDAPAVYNRSFVTGGTFAPASAPQMPGDVATWIRYTTARTDSRGHPVYLRNYYHGVYQGAGGVDVWLSSQQTAFQTYGSAWVAGFSDGTVTHKRTGPDSLGATGASTAPFLARRLLKRRG